MADELQTDEFSAVFTRNTNEHHQINVFFEKNMDAISILNREANQTPLAQLLKISLEQDSPHAVELCLAVGAKPSVKQLCDHARIPTSSRNHNIAFTFAKFGYYLGFSLGTVCPEFIQFTNTHPFYFIGTIANGEMLTANPVELISERQSSLDTAIEMICESDHEPNGTHDSKLRAAINTVIEYFQMVRFLYPEILRFYPRQLLDSCQHRKGMTLHSTKQILALAKDYPTLFNIKQSLQIIRDSYGDHGGFWFLPGKANPPLRLTQYCELKTKKFEETILAQKDNKRLNHLTNFIDNYSINYRMKIMIFSLLAFSSAALVSSIATLITTLLINATPQDTRPEIFRNGNFINTIVVLEAVLCAIFIFCALLFLYHLRESSHNTRNDDKLFQQQQTLLICCRSVLIFYNFQGKESTALQQELKQLNHLHKRLQQEKISSTSLHEITKLILKSLEIIASITKDNEKIPPLPSCFKNITIKAEAIEDSDNNVKRYKNLGIIYPASLPFFQQPNTSTQPTRTSVIEHPENSEDSEDEDIRLVSERSLLLST